MKKLGKLKWLLSLAAVLMLLGGLVACSDGGDDNPPISGPSVKPTPAPVAPEVDTLTPTIDATLEVGSGKTYTTVQSALDKIMTDKMTGGVVVKIEPGTYEEFVFYTGSATVFLEGTGTAKYGTDVVIKQSNSGNTNSMEALAKSHGVSSGYFRGATRFDGTCNLILKNLTIQNTYSRSANNGSNTQAEAIVFSSKGKLIAYNCSFLSHQDTLYIGSQGNRSWFYKCQIKGDVDFIWGYADVALYEECDIWALADDNKNTDTLSASRTMVEAVEANKGIVIMNSTVHMADGVVLTFARNSGADTNASFFNNVFLADGEAKTGKVADAIYGAKPNYEVYDANHDLVVGWKDGRNYTDAAKTTLVNTSARLDGTNALVDRYINREYSGRYAILNRGWNFTEKKFKTASAVWDLSKYETEFNATSDASKGQIFVDPVASQKVVSGNTVTLKAYDINGNDISSAVTWTCTEASNVTTNKGNIVKSLLGGVLVTNATKDNAVVDGTVTVTAKLGNYTDTAYVYVIPAYIKADKVTFAQTSGSVAQGSSFVVKGTISSTADANADPSDKTTVWKVSDPTVAMVFDKANNKLLGEYTATTCDAVIYGVKAGSTTITASSADGGKATYTVTVTGNTVYYLPEFAGVYVNTDVQSGCYGVWNGILIDAVTKNPTNGASAKMSMKQGNNRMQTRNIILNVPVKSDTTIKVTLETSPVTVATATTAPTLAYNGLYADGTKITYTGATYTKGSATIDEAAYKALSAEEQAAYTVATKPYYTIGFDFETQAQTASLTDLSSYQTKQVGIDTKELNSLTEAKWCQIGPFGSTDVYVTEIAITPEENGKYSYAAATPLDVAVAFTNTELEKLDVNGTTTATRTATVTGADAAKVTVKYSSSDTAVATVDDKTGAVTAKGMGYAAITATIPKNSDSTEFTTASYNVIVKNSAPAASSYKIALTALKLPKNSDADFGQIVGTDCFWNDNVHGWQLISGSTLKFAVKGAAKIKVGGCKHGTAGTLTLTDGTTTVTGDYSLDCETATELAWAGTTAATLTLTYTGGTKAYVPYIKVEESAPTPAATSVNYTANFLALTNGTAVTVDTYVAGNDGTSSPNVDLSGFPTKEVPLVIDGSSKNGLRIRKDTNNINYNGGTAAAFAKTAVGETLAETLDRSVALDVSKLATSGNITVTFKGIAKTSNKGTDYLGQVVLIDQASKILASATNLKIDGTGNAEGVDSFELTATIDASAVTKVTLGFSRGGVGGGGIDVTAITAKSAE
ncbi:MAG: Ig-like domain-containing protein [Treponema sp.]|nr:Ig-like domain-containing protein [Treponema sp.]